MDDDDVGRFYAEDVMDDADADAAAADDDDLDNRTSWADDTDDDYYDDDAAEGGSSSGTEEEVEADEFVSFKKNPVHAKIARLFHEVFESSTEPFSRKTSDVPVPVRALFRQVYVIDLTMKTALRHLFDAFTSKLNRILEEQDKMLKEALLPGAMDQISTASLVAEEASGSRTDIRQFWGKILPLAREVTKTVKTGLNKLGAELKKELDENCQRLTSKWEDEAWNQWIDEMGDKEEAAKLRPARKRRRRHRRRRF